MQIIANEISNLTDARYFAAMGVDWIQYSLDPASDSAINPTILNGLKAWVEGPETIVHFGLESPDTIKELAETLDIKVISLPMFYPIADLEKLSQFQIFQQFVVSIDNVTNLAEWFKDRKELVAHFHIDFSSNHFTWKQVIDGDSPIKVEELVELQSKNSCFISLWESSAPEVVSLKEALPKTSLVLKGGAEEKVGFKSFDELDEIFEQLEANA